MDNENKIAERTKKIVVLPGDGIGPEIVSEALKVLEAVKGRFGLKLSVETLPVGGSAYDLCGKCLPEATLEKCKAADAVLLGAVGGPKWDSLSGAERPERALLGLRSRLGLFCNLRPARIWPSLADASPIKCADAMVLALALSLPLSLPISALAPLLVEAQEQVLPLAEVLALVSLQALVPLLVVVQE